MLQWIKLKPKDTIDIIAPGYPFETEVLNKSILALERIGYNVRVPDNLLKEEYFHSNSDSNRFAHLKKALLSPDSSAVWCIRGGYGSNRLIPHLLKIKKPNRSKLFIGISDVTSIHLFLNQKWKWPTLHAALLDRIAKDSLPTDVLKETLDIISGEKSQITFSNLKLINSSVKIAKKITAPIVGGNLVVLQTSIGTYYQLNLKNKFLFIEEFGERGYRIDRILEHFKQAGLFKECKGLLLGQFIGGEEPNGALRINEALERFAKENPKLPIISGVESGHGERLRALPFGTNSILSRISENNFEIKIATGCRNK
jgi:muramoyltetrapeptide carboxypeptidase